MLAAAITQHLLCCWTIYKGLPVAGSHAMLMQATEQEAVCCGQVCNHGLRLMLRGEAHRLHEYRDELSRYGQHFTDRGNMAGALFIYVLYK